MQRIYLWHWLLGAMVATGCGGQGQTSTETVQKGPAMDQTVIQDSEPTAEAPNRQISVQDGPQTLTSDPGKFVVPRPSALEAAIIQALSKRPGNYIARTKHFNRDGTPVFTNRLIFERSPYLGQHAHNPVDWFPWGEEAFEVARQLGRPVFLSIGYTTCHWCHVMEEESFEDLEIAAYLNANFVPVKLDREERPDVDSVYMTAVNILTGRGGWPMSVWMTPGKEPFMAGTYFPPRDGDRGSRKGFLTILRELKAEYDANPDAISDKASDLVKRMGARSRGRYSNSLGNDGALRAGKAAYGRIFDATYGGFGRGNKFPRPANLEFLLRYLRRTGDPSVKNMVIKTLDAMLLGGLYDHIDDGFHRYTTERRFRIPHFEKMLYDNAQLVPVYLQAFQYFGDTRYREVAAKTLDYLIRDMRDEGGGFYSATDADSEGEEGIFAVWKPEQVRQLMPRAVADFMNAHYNITSRGNFEHGTTVLYTTGSIEETGNTLGVSAATALQLHQQGHQLMFEARRKREQPVLDDKILTAWNGLAISAFAQAALVLGDLRYLETAQACADFLRGVLYRDGRLMRRYHSGEVRFEAVLDDYAYLIQGLLDLYEASGDMKELEWALQLQEEQDERFSSAGGGYFRANKSEEDLIVQEMPDYDGARPSGNSVAALNLLRLYGLSGDTKFLRAAEGVFKVVGRSLARGTTSQPKLLSALDYYLDRDLQIVLAGPPLATSALIRGSLGEYWMPNRVIGYQGSPSSPSEYGILKDKGMLQGKPTAYVCEEGVCQRPVHTARDLLAQIRSMHRVVGGDGLKEVEKRSKE